MENKKTISPDDAMNHSGSMKNLIQLSFGEEVGNAITHGVMAVICLFLLPVAAIKAYLEGVPPKEKRQQQLCEALSIDPDSITSDDLCMSVNECAALLGKSSGWVKNAIEQGTLPGSYTKTSTGHRDFHIPRLRIAEYLGLIGSNNIKIPHDLIVEVCR